MWFLFHGVILQFCWPISPEPHYGLCGCSKLHGPFGTLLSPGYPENYHQQLECVWRIEVDPAQVGDITILSSVCAYWCPIKWMLVVGISLYLCILITFHMNQFQQVIIFTFREFDLGVDCFANALIYFDGSSPNVTSQRFCGNQPLWIVSSTSHVVVFQLILGSNHTSHGFRLDYSSGSAPVKQSYPILRTRTGGELQRHG